MSAGTRFNAVAVNHHQIRRILLDEIRNSGDGFGEHDIQAVVLVLIDEAIHLVETFFFHLVARVAVTGQHVHTGHEHIELKFGMVVNRMHQRFQLAEIRARAGQK